MKSSRSRRGEEASKKGEGVRASFALREGRPTTPRDATGDVADAARGQVVVVDAAQGQLAVEDAARRPVLTSSERR